MQSFARSTSTCQRCSRSYHQLPLLHINRGKDCSENPARSGSRPLSAGVSNPENQTEKVINPPSKGPWHDSKEYLERKFYQVGHNFNKFSGYEQIEDLKAAIGEIEQRISSARENAKLAKKVYEDAQNARMASQRESNELLQRKAHWSDSDVSKFTELIRQDHLNEQTEKDARIALEDVEDQVHKGFSDLMKAILARYHEEQIWSDKIRSISTYGQFGITGINVLLFIVAIIIVEPWRRSRLVQGVEARLVDRERDAAAKSDQGLEVIMERFEAAELKLDMALESLGVKEPLKQFPDDMTFTNEPKVPLDEAIEKIQAGDPSTLLVGLGGILIGGLTTLLIFIGPWKR